MRFLTQFVAAFVSALLLVGCAAPTGGRQNSAQAGASAAQPAIPVSAAPITTIADPYIWLENSKDPAVRPWVDSHNQKTTAQLETDPRAKALSSEIHTILSAKDRIPMPSFVSHGQMVRNFWQDDDHKRGVWRQTTLVDYLKSQPTWTTLIDVDELNRLEGKSWVFKKASCLPPVNDLCLIELSDGGRDEVEVREFQVSKKSFLNNGFIIPPAKTDASWYDADTLLLGTDFGPGSLTSSGYPKEVRLWHRGEPMAQAKVIFTGADNDVSVVGRRLQRRDSAHVFVTEETSSITSKTYYLDEAGKLELLPFPDSASFEGELKGYLFAALKADWVVNGQTLVSGTLVSLPFRALGRADAASQLETAFVPTADTAFEDVSFTKDFGVLSVLKNVRGETLQITRPDSANKWVLSPIKIRDNGTVALRALDPFDDANRIFASYESFNVPPSLYYGSSGDFRKGLRVIKQLSPKYAADSVVVEQFHAQSKDGTRVPYFVVHQKGYKLNSSNPTLLYAYGGFQLPQTPFYLGPIGKVWLEKGGVYVLANIRGGGEFGARWHTAGLKLNRQRVYEDFAAVAQSLVQRKITSSRRLGIQGGSNGGLLVGVAMTQHPDYYHAVICESALLDMLRYTQMPPGASWIGEYGDPADPVYAAYIVTYSPYQNLKPGVHYPKIFFHISTADDRVQPGHTRKMAARLEELGDDFLFFENTEGGHGGAADISQRVRKSTLEYTYLYQQLMD